MKTNKAFQIRFLSLVVAALCASGAQAQLAPGALPTGGTVVGGQASVVQNGTTLNIHQTSNQALVNFSTFNVGSGALVDIRQPGAAAALLARVTGQDPSQIYGQIKANGSLWLINPSGILVGQGARIDVGGFIASTLNVSDADFLAGRLTFTSAGNAGIVTNAGAIHAAGGGRIYLVGQKVENTGALTAPGGEVLLAAGQNVQIVDTGHPGVSIALSGAAGDVRNMGRIAAEAGRIGLGGALVTNAGEISASSAVSEGGRVFLRAADLKTTATSNIGANGTSGGHVVLAADRADIDGRVSATGSAGPGGFVDTSGHVSLDGRHAPTVGKGGEWLIDPSNLEVVAGSGGDAGVDGGVITSSETGTTIGADVISAQLNGGTSVVLATGNEGAGLGDILVNAAITKTSGEDARLTLRAHNNIAINAPITSSAGALNLSLKTNFYGNTTDAGHSASLSADVNLNGGVLEVSQGEALGNGTLNINAGTTTLGGASRIEAAAVNVGQGGRVAIGSLQTLRGAWANAGEIDLQDDGALNLEDPSASFVNNGRLTLSGYNATPLTGTTDGANLTNNSEVVKTSSTEQTIEGMASGPASRLTVDAGRLTLTRTILGGRVDLAPTSMLILRDSSLAGGADITGTGAMMWSGNVTLLGDVTLGANAPTLSDDPDRFFTFIRGSGYKLTSHGVVNAVRNLVLDSGVVWDNHGTVNVGPAAPGVLAFNLGAVLNNKSGGVIDVRDGARLELATTSVVNNEAGALLQVASAGTSSFSGGYQGAIFNSGTIVKTGVGTTPAPLTNLTGGVLKIEEGAFGVVFSEANANAGTVDIASGATLRSTGGVDLHNAGTIRGTGTVELGDEGGKLVNNGVVAPGGSDRVGTLTVNGGYTQGPQGVLNIRLAGTIADMLDVTGPVELAGALHLSNLGPDAAANGTVADFLTGNNAGAAGSFGVVSAPPVVIPDTTTSLSVVYPATGTTVAQVKSTTVPTVVVPPVEPPVVTPPVEEPPVVVPPVTPVPSPSDTPAAPAPAAVSELDVCRLAPDSAICRALSPPTPDEPVKPTTVASNEVIKTVAAISYANLSTASTSEIASDVSRQAATTDATGTKNEPAKKMFCN